MGGTEGRTEQLSGKRAREEFSPTMQLQDDVQAGCFLEVGERDAHTPAVVRVIEVLRSEEGTLVKCSAPSTPAEATVWRHPGELKRGVYAKTGGGH